MTSAGPGLRCCEEGRPPPKPEGPYYAAGRGAQFGGRRLARESLRARLTPRVWLRTGDITEIAPPLLQFQRRTEASSTSITTARGIATAPARQSTHRRASPGGLHVASAGVPSLTNDVEDFMKRKTRPAHCEPGSMQNARELGERLRQSRERLVASPLARIGRAWR